MNSGIKKYSVRINGHPTSITLEQPFWDELGLMAKKQGLSINQLIAKIDQMRIEQTQQMGNLSSCLRVYVLERIRAERQLLSTGHVSGGI